MSTEEKELQEALTLIDRKKNEIIKLTSDLIKIRSVNPPGNMHEIAIFVEDLLKAEGIHVNRIEPERGKISLIASIGGGNPELVFNGHMDVVPPGELNMWRFDPFSGAFFDGYIHGRGASDMKGGLAAMINAFLTMIKYESRFNGKLTLVLVPDEETGGLMGTKYLIDNGVVIGDHVIIGEPTGLEYVDIGQKGVLWLKLKFRGKSTHGSLAPYLGDNAILKAYKAIEELSSITKLKPNPPEDIKHIIETSINIADTLIGVKNIGKLILKSPTFNVGVIRGGSKINMVPDYCEVDIDIRIPIGLTFKEVLNLIHDSIRSYKAEIELINSFEANYTSPNEELVKVLEHAITLVLGKKPQLFVQWASSDARFYRAKGVPTVHYGPGEVEGIHGYNERVKAEDVVNASKAYLTTAFKMLESSS
jgi:succinyl-diaminopimelate desuccinylase